MGLFGPLLCCLLAAVPCVDSALPPWPSEMGVGAGSSSPGSPGVAGVADQPSATPPTDLKKKEDKAGYGVDVSFPIHHTVDRRSFQGKRYDEFMKGCYNTYGRPSCDSSERSRMRLNLMQPETQQNYTDRGYAKVRAPEGAFAPLQQFFRDHKQHMRSEQWPRGNTYTNHWGQNPTYMLSLEDNRWKEGRRIKSQVWDAVRGMLEEWTGEKLKPSSLYGIRVYKEGAMLASHVDRLPLVTSAIINVDQELRSPWPVEIYSHDGRAENVTMAPGDMVMYESHTCVHGRPTPLDGEYYANVFVHFIPVDQEGHEKNEGSSESMRYPPPHHDAVRGGHSPGLDGGKNHLRAAPEAKDDHDGGDQHPYEPGHEHGGGDGGGGGGGGAGETPDETPEEREEREEQEAAFATGSTSLHLAAARGDVAAVEREIARLSGGGADRTADGAAAAAAAEEEGAVSDSIDAADSNNWHPLHEAARAGHLEVVKKLVDAGADLGATTFQGGTPLWWARETNGEENEVVQFLRKIGAPDFSEGDEL